MHSLSRPALKNWNGIDVGGLRPAEALLSLRSTPYRGDL